MKTSLITSLLLLAAVAFGDAPMDAEWPNPWRSASFRKAFMGSYGVRSDIEPSMTSVEREELEKIATLMAIPGGIPRAQLLLRRMAKPAATALVDFTLANLYLQEGEMEAAAGWYRKALTKFPAFQRAYKNLGLAEIQRGEFKPAVEALTRAVELGDYEGRTFGLLGHALAMSEQFTSSESAYRLAMMLQPTTLDWKLGLARTLFKQRKFAEAVTLCDELIRSDPARPDYWTLQANAFLGMGKPLQAAQNYEYLVAAGKSSVDTLNTLGDIYVNENNFDLAADAYLEALTLGKDGKPSRFVRNAEVLAARGALNEASRVVNAIDETFEGRIDDTVRKRMLKLQARLAAADGSAEDEHVRLLEALVKLDPLDGEALILLGRHHASKGSIERASFLFERAQGIEAYEAQACLRHGQCLVKAERYADAVRLLKRAQELSPREDVARYLEQVQRVARSQ